MPGSVNEEQTVTLISSTSISEDSEITLKDPPSPEVAEKTILDMLNIAPPILPKAPGLQDKEDKNLFDLSTEVLPPSLEEIKGETHDWVSQTASLGLGGLSGNGSEEHIYAAIDPNTKSSKKSLDSGIGGQNSKDDLGTSSNTLPSYKSKDDSEESLSLNSDIGSTTNKKTNRFLPRAKYAMQQKGFVIPATSFFLITTYLSSSCLYRLLYLKETINFIDYIKSFQIWPLVTISSGLAVIGLCAFIYNHRNTESPAMRDLDDLSNVVSNNNLVHDITIYKKNNDLVKFKNKSYAGHREIPNFTYKKLKLVKERTLFNVCLSSLITVGSIYPLIKYLELGSEGFIKFFRFSSGKEELMISKLLVSENNAKLLSYFNDHNLKLIAFAAVLIVLAASMVCISAYYHNEKTHIEPLKFNILVKDDVKARNNRYFEAVKGECDKISTEIETVVVRHYNDVDEEKKITVLAL
ncbi:hypothetical protein [Wolbachia endosymbiont of Psylliodes chrysocephala]|uniref:hypothetical protein n=1 Tax=Wolbachia endosymbiont of Psylliodes chrysocephala TaxID=2883236 RepID=UPI0020A00C22|nr:hypothetical protein [Wolbachia endosymbiont of Psylliodes chrysocephala]